MHLLAAPCPLTCNQSVICKKLRYPINTSCTSRFHFRALRPNNLHNSPTSPRHLFTLASEAKVKQRHWDNARKSSLRDGQRVAYSNELDLLHRPAASVSFTRSTRRWAGTAFTLLPSPYPSSALLEPAFIEALGAEPRKAVGKQQQYAATKKNGAKKD